MPFALRTPRRGHAAAQLADGRVLVCGGAKAVSLARRGVCDFSDPCSLGSVELVDAEATRVEDAPPLPAPREQAILVATPDGALLVGGLESGGACMRTPGETFLWDARACTWREGPALPGALGRSVVALADGRVLVSGGCGDAVDASAWVWSPDDASWTRVSPLHEARYGHQGVLLADGRVLVVGGLGGAQGDLRVLASCELFDLRTGRFVRAAPLPRPRSDFTLARLADGAVLAIGGSHDTETACSTVERWDPATETWSAVGSLAEARFGHTATALPGGGMLVVGGASRAGGTPRVGEPCVHTERFDPATGAWTQADALASPRLGHTATLLQGGRVLVLGGEDGRGEPLASAELLSTAPQGRRL